MNSCAIDLAEAPAERQRVRRLVVRERDVREDAFDFAGAPAERPRAVRGGRNFREAGLDVGDAVRGFDLVRIRDRREVDRGAFLSERYGHADAPRLRARRRSRSRLDGLPAPSTQQRGSRQRTSRPRRPSAQTATPSASRSGISSGAAAVACRSARCASPVQRAAAASAASATTGSDASAVARQRRVEQRERQRVRQDDARVAFRPHARGSCAPSAARARTSARRPGSLTDVRHRVRCERDAQPVLADEVSQRVIVREVVAERGAGRRSRRARRAGRPSSRRSNTSAVRPRSRRAPTARTARRSTSRRAATRGRRRRVRRDRCTSRRRRGRRRTRAATASR